MTVQTLKRLLDQHPDDMEVHFVYNYGDHWRTKVAPQVECVDTAYVIHSDYHRMDKVLEADDPEDGLRVVVLKS